MARTMTSLLPPHGLLLDVFSNTALSGVPASTSVTPSLAPLRISGVAAGPFSAEVTGVLTFPQYGRYNFECAFTGVAAAFVWVSDHQVCVSGAYDNVRSDRSSMDGSPAYPLISSAEMRNANMTLRIQLWSNASASSDPTSVHVRWRVCSGGDCSAVPLQEIPQTALTPRTPPLEQRRAQLQRSLVSGWGAWQPRNYLSLISLPDSARLSLMLCQLSSHACLTASVGPDDKAAIVRPGLHALDRSYAQYYVGYRGFNTSVRWSGGAGGLRVALQPVSCAVAPGIQNCSDFAVVLASDFAWWRSGTVATACTGERCRITLTPHELPQHVLTATLVGSQTTGAARCDVAGFSIAPPSVALPQTGAGLALRLDGNGATLYVSSLDERAEDTSEAIDDAEQRERTDLASHGPLAETAGAVRAALMWNSVFLPAEQGPVLPVDRSWDLSKFPANDDWRYTNFQWDNHFASYMMA
eukprot:4360210-Prymnesium_polylepis.1